jgi:hypothetical protein
VFRDPLATALRENISVKADVLAKMEDILRVQEKMIQCIRACKVPRLLLSADKIRYYKEELITELISFLNLKCTENQMQEAMSFIALEPSRYLNEARVDRTVGRIDQLSQKRITGWVRLVSTEAPCHVTLKVNNERRSTCTADIFRLDILAKGAHSTGKCGFEFVFNGTEMLTHDDHVELVVEEDGASFLYSGKLAQWGGSEGLKHFPIK